MKNIIRQIIAHENLEEIYKFAQESLFIDSPVSSTTLEILSYLKLFAPEFFSTVQDEVLSLMGVFYKKPSSTTLKSQLLNAYGEYIFETYHKSYTPVQASIVREINEAKNFSFSAPTSTGKSFVFRDLIQASEKDVAMIVPSRALINEYYDRVCSLIPDKSVNVLTFVDIINTKRARRSVFILTPERAKELFKYKNQLSIELFLFDEAQLSDEESVRGLFFDSIVRRAQKAFPDAKYVFAHPFVTNPEAQLEKNGFNSVCSTSISYDQKNVGQIFFAVANGNYYHFGLNPAVMGAQKIKSDFDPVMNALRRGGSVLVYTTKASIYDQKVFEQFQIYINECRPIKNPIALHLIDQFKRYIGASDQGEGYYRSQMLENMRRGIIIHHGSLPLQARLILEHFTQQGFCRICFATSTLEQGINMPFDVVYLNTFQASKPLSMKNLIGRAGRSTLHTTFDYGSVIVKYSNMSDFRGVMMHKETLDTVSQLDISEDKDSDYNDFKTAINSNSYSDEYNLTFNEVERLNSSEVTEQAIKTLNALFRGNELVPLRTVNDDLDCKLQLYGHFRTLYKYHLGRPLSDGEESVLNTAIKILLWKIYGKSFKNICWYRYTYIARIPERRDLGRKYRIAGSESVRQSIRAQAKRLTARFVRGYAEIPDKELRNFPLYPQGTKAREIDYDRIVFDTYDYLDKLISFKLSDIFYAIFEQCHRKTGDIRAFRLARLFKYGTDDDKEIWMLRYGLSFEEIEILKPYIEAIDQGEIRLMPTAYSDLTADQLRPIARYI